MHVHTLNPICHIVFAADKYSWKIKGEFTSGTNILGLVFFSVVLGITLGLLKEKGKALLDVFVALSESMMLITSWVIWISPVGVSWALTMPSKVQRLINI